jgi:hypothetical protein
MFYVTVIMFIIVIILITALIFVRSNNSTVKGCCGCSTPWTSQKVHDLPKHIVIIRHGEKDKEAGSFLDTEGIYRAHQLVKWSKEFPKSNGFSSFGAVFAPVPYTGTSVRPEQTAQPLSFANEIPLFALCAAGQFECVHSLLRRLPGIAGGSVLMVWEHTCIPALVSSIIGKKWMYEWGKDDYSSIVVIDTTTGAVSLSCQSVTGTDIGWNESNLLQCHTLVPSSKMQKCKGEEWVTNTFLPDNLLCQG